MIFFFSVFQGLWVETLVRSVGRGALWEALRKMLSLCLPAMCPWQVAGIPDHGVGAAGDSELSAPGAQLLRGL